MYNAGLMYKARCALTDRHFTKCERNCHMPKNKCVRFATLTKERFSVYVVMPGSFSRACKMAPKYQRSVNHKGVLPLGKPHCDWLGSSERTTSSIWVCICFQTSAHVFERKRQQSRRAF